MSSEVGQSEERHIFPPRPGTKLDSHLEVLKKDPEITINAEERKEVLAYEAELTYGEDKNKKERQLGLEEIWKSNINTSEFYLEYFLTEKGQTDLSKTFNLDLDKIKMETTDEVANLLYSKDYSSLDPSIIKSFSGRSVRYGKNKMVEQFSNSNFKSVENITPPTKITVVRNAEDLATKVKNLRQLKKFLKEKKVELGSNKDNLSIAKKTITEIHLRRVNELIVEEYPLVIAFIKQSHSLPPESVKETIDTLSENLVVEGIIGGMKNESIVSRLDRFSQGAETELKDDDKYSITSKEALSLVAELGDYNQEEENSTEKTNLSTARVNANELKSWFKDVLSEYDLLSKYDDNYNPDRLTRAKDRLWQVVFDPEKSSLDVDSKQGVIKIPTDFDRGIADISPTGAIPLIAHEITHIIQNENKEKISLSLMDDIGTDRYLIVSEAGATVQEEEAQQYFGNILPTEPHYLEAMKKRLNGGNLAECAKAFFDSRIKQDPNADKKEVAKLAFDRATRLFRKEGDFNSKTNHLTNSQPLVYLEQELLVRELSKKGLSKLLLLGGASIQTLADLHKIGMLDMNKITFPKRSVIEILGDEIKAKIA